MTTNYSKYGPLKRGDFNQKRTMRFWSYLKGKECWMTIERFRESTTRIYKQFRP